MSAEIVKDGIVIVLPSWFTWFIVIWAAVSVPLAAVETYLNWRLYQLGEDRRTP